MNLNYLVIDLSGIIKIDDSISHAIGNMILMLKLIGTTPVLTGIRPDLAVAVTQLNLGFLGDLTIESNLERALKRIGLTFIQQES